MSRPEVVCMTPVKNEGWILESFLAAASLWADRIIVGNDASADDSREIAQSFAKVHLVDLPGTSFDEGVRRAYLVARARERVQGPSVLFALDADEAVSSEMLDRRAWEPVFSSPPGTVIRLQWANLAPDRRHAWLPRYSMPIGFIDDGSPFPSDVRINTVRVPPSSGPPDLVLDGPVLLHRQYLDWDRMKSKQRFYQLWELLVEHKRPLNIWRQYHHMDAVPSESCLPIKDEWLAGYISRGLDLLSVREQAPFYWDGRVLDWIDERGLTGLQKLDLWDVNWPEVCRQLHRALPRGMHRDPRSEWERSVHRWLARTQGRELSMGAVYWGDKALKLIGW